MKNPVQFVAYDILYFDKEDVVKKPLLERKRLLEENVTEGFGLSVSRFITEKGDKAF